MYRSKKRWGLLSAPLIALGVFATSCTTPSREWYEARPSTDSRPLILAHQGGEKEEPSNTKAAFDNAVAAGVDALDTDTFVTADNIPVLFHDEELQHRTNGSGPIASKSLAELQQLDFAYLWSPNDDGTYPRRGQGITVMTMADLFDLYPQQRYGIELKQITPDAVSVVCQTIKGHNKEKQVLVSSATQPNMDTFRAQCPEVATSATEDEARPFVAAVKNTGSANTIVDPPYSSLQLPETYTLGETTITIVDQQLVDAAHNHPSKLKVIPWTIDTTEQACRFAKYGVDGINVNYPHQFRPAGAYPDILTSGSCPLSVEAA